LFKREQSFLALVRRETTLSDFTTHPTRLVVPCEREHEFGVLPRGHLKRDDLDKLFDPLGYTGVATALIDRVLAARRS